MGIGNRSGVSGQKRVNSLSVLEAAIDGSERDWYFVIVHEYLRRLPELRTYVHTRSFNF